MEKKIGKNDPCWCGSGNKYKFCHAGFDDKLEVYRRNGHKVPPRKIIKTPEQIAGIKESCKVNIAVLDYVGENLKSGMSTEDINRMVHEKTLQLGGIPAPLNYNGFPKSV